MKEYRLYLKSFFRVHALTASVWRILNGHKSYPNLSIKGHYLKLQVVNTFGLQQFDFLAILK